MENNSTNKTLSEIKGELTDLVLILFALFGIPLLIVSLMRVTTTGWIWNYSFQIVIFLLLILMAIFRRRVKAGIKITYVLVIFMFVYLQATITFGLLSSGGIFIVCLTVLTFLLADSKKTLFVFIVAITQYIVIDLCHYFKFIKTGFDVIEYIENPASWLTNIISLLSVCVILFVLQNHLFKQFFQIISEKNRTNDELYNTNQKLCSEVDKSRELKQSLSESEMRFRRLSENAPVAIFRIKMLPEIHFDYVNKKMSDIFNCSADDFYKVKVLENEKIYYLDKDAARELLFNRECWGVPRTLRFNTGNKIELWTEITIVPVENEDGTVIYLEGILQDITSRYRTQLDLLESEVRYKTIFNSITNGLIMFDVSGAIVDVNKEFIIMRESSEAEVKLRTFEELLPEGYKNVAYSLIETVTGGEPFITEVKMLTQKGNWIDAEIRGAQIKLKGQKYYLAVIRNITEHKQMQMQLLQVDKMASLGVLVSGIAHEINNPNNYIKLNAKIIEQAWNDAIPILNEYARSNGDFTVANVPYSSSRDQIRAFARGISDGAERIKNIVNSLKDFARQDTGEMNHIIDLWSVIESSMVILDSMIKTRAAFVNMHCETRTISVRGNFQQLEQVLINLTTNALQSLTSKGKGIFLTLEKVDGSYAVIKIRDEGEGISPMELEKIFDPFYTTKRESGGTGLGLSISYTIIKNHNGTIEYESEVGIGTTVTVKLPLYVENKSAVLTKKSPES